MFRRTINSLKNKETSNSNTIISQLENSENRERIIHKSLRLNDCFRYELALYSEFPNVLIRERLFRYNLLKFLTFIHFFFFKIASKSFYETLSAKLWWETRGKSKLASKSSAGKTYLRKSLKTNQVSLINFDLFFF